MSDRFSRLRIFQPTFRSHDHKEDYTTPYHTILSIVNRLLSCRNIDILYFRKWRIHPNQIILPPNRTGQRNLAEYTIPLSLRKKGL